MAETNLYKLLSGLYTAASNINTKVGNKNAQNGSAFEQLTALSTAVNGKFTPRLANGTSGLVYSGGDVTIAQGIISLNNGVVDTAELANSAVKTDKIDNKAVTEAKLADALSTKVGRGETAYGKVSGTNGEWHKHTNMATLSGIKDTDVSNWNDANDKKHVHANLSTLSGIGPADVNRWDAAANANHTHGNLSVLSGIQATDITKWNNGALVSAVVLEKTTTTDGYAATYQLKVNGTAQTTKIDIVKDQFIKSAKFGWSTVKTSDGTGWVESKPSTGTYYPCIKIEVWTNVDGTTSSSDTTTTIYVPLADVFQEYVGGSGIKVDGNTISLSGIPSNITITSGQLPTIPASKLEHGSNYETAVTQAADWNTSKGTVVKTSAATTFKNGTVVLGTGSPQTVKNSEYTVATASSNFGANTLATAPAITGYIAAQGFQKSADMDSFVTTSENSLADDTIILGAGGKGVKNGVKIVSTSGDIAATSGATMVPTAGAVSSYVANKTTNMVTGTGLTTDKLVVGNNGGAVKVTSISSGDVVTAAATLTNNNLIVGSGSKGVASSNIVATNVVTNSTGNATVVSGIIVAAAKDKSVQATAYTINATATSGAISGNGANQIPNVQAVKAYTDAQDTAAKNYLLNGNASTSTGVTDWAGDADTVGSLAELNAKVNALLASIQ